VEHSGTGGTFCPLKTAVNQQNRAFKLGEIHWYPGLFSLKLRVKWGKIGFFCCCFALFSAKNIEKSS